MSIGVKFDNENQFSGKRDCLLLVLSVDSSVEVLLLQIFVPKSKSSMIRKVSCEVWKCYLRKRRGGEEQNREEGKMAQTKLGGGRNRGKK